MAEGRLANIIKAGMKAYILVKERAVTATHEAGELWEDLREEARYERSASPATSGSAPSSATTSAAAARPATSAGSGAPARSSGATSGAATRSATSARSGSGAKAAGSKSGAKAGATRAGAAVAGTAKAGAQKASAATRRAEKSAGAVAKRALDAATDRERPEGAKAGGPAAPAAERAPVSLKPEDRADAPKGERIAPASGADDAKK